ncbi:hypothetical protein [Natronomonas sp. EA1]|uniref:hypothetical protein n=1 Tax=Natronomonas sp. EA1 TaxID=3421655 RepID=UPI003EBABD0F
MSGEGAAETPRDGGEEPAVWYRSPRVVAVFGIDVLLTLVVAGTTVLFKGFLPDLGKTGDFSVQVPWEVYAFSVLGALGFVFTALIRDFDRTPAEIVQYHFRIPAAIPLGAGVYLLSTLILGVGPDGTPNDTLVAGVVFLSGLYVNLAYERLSALADRLLPKRGRTAE